jgi:manganese/iron transport system permease protein
LVALAVAIGIGTSVLGLYVSYWLDVATGATIVLVQTALFLAALALGPRTGLLSRRRPSVAASPIAAGERIPG